MAPVAPAAARIQIRGSRVDMASDETGPIIYLDGELLAEGMRLDEISPTTIDRVEILKDAAAERMHPGAGDRGVVQIFLKKDGGGS